MIELQNEQLANCLIFDEETFNYPLVEKVPYCLKLICPFWLLPCPWGLSVSGYPFLLLTNPLPPWVSASPSSKDNHKHELGPDSILFVKCSSKIWALGKKMKGQELPPSQRRDQAGQFPLTLSCLGVCIPSVHKGYHCTGPEAHSLSAAPSLPPFGSQYNGWQCTPRKHNSFLKLWNKR